MADIADAAVASALDADRAMNGRRVAAIRVVIAPLYCLLYFIFGRLLDLEAWRGGDVPLLPYAIAAAVIFVLARRSPVFARRSGVFVPSIDVPAAFVLQLTMLGSASNAGAVIAFNLATMFLFVLLSAMWLSPRLPIVTAALAAASQSTLFVLAGANPAIAVSVFTLLLVGGSVCAYVASRTARIVATLARQLEDREALRVKAIELELQNRRMSELARDKDKFLANVSHELRTPLNAIIGFGELIADGAATPEMTKEFAEDILSSGRHLLSLISTILDNASLDAGRLEIVLEPTALEQLVEDVVSTLRASAHKKQITLKIEHDAGLSTVRIDPRRFRQILYNYVSNAVKFTPAGGVVTLRTKKHAESFRIEVEDTGAGISAAELSSLFSEFSRLKNAEGIEGTGLGLALTKRLVEAHGGVVGATSTLGKGSVFYALLPLGDRLITFGRVAGPSPAR